MRIAFERRDFLRSTQCFVCNQQEAGILFSDDYDDFDDEDDEDTTTYEKIPDAPTEE